MIEDNLTLSYDFYFLFRRDAHELENVLPLPELPRKNLLGDGIYVDEDKVLISRSYNQKPLENSLQLLMESWQKIVKLHTKDTIPEEAIAEACQAALLGVAMVIMDDSLDSHSLEMKIQENSGQSSTIIFKRSQEALFILEKEKVSIPFEQFTACFADGNCKNRYAYSLFFQNGEIFLKPVLGEEILDKETTRIPIFAVYGIEHAGVEAATETGLSWPTELRRILTGAGKDSKKLPILVPVISRLLMRQWQFTRLECAATQLRSDLQKDVAYRQLSQAELKCKSNHQLEQNLEEVIDKHTGQVKHLQARLLQAIRTLEINQNNLDKRLKESQSYCQTQNWELMGQDSLVETFKRDMRTLENHQAYLTGEMLHLEGLHKRWHLQLDGRKLALSEHLGTLGHILILLVALGEVANITTQSHDNTATPPAHEVSKSSDYLKSLDEMGNATTQLHDNAIESNIHETTKDHENSKSLVGGLSSLSHGIYLYLAITLIFVSIAIVPPLVKWFCRIWFCRQYKKYNRKIGK